MSAHEWITTYSNPLPSCLDKLEVSVPKVERTLEPAQLAALDDLMLKLLSVCLSDLKTPDSFEKRCAHLPGFYRRWFAESLRLLNGLDAAESFDSLWDQWAKLVESLPHQADHKAHLFLVETCLRALPDILAGKQKATDVLFPDSSMALVEGIYKGNAIADMFNQVLGDSVLAYFRQRLALDPKARFKILEIGAGTGGTTAGLIEKLKPLEAHISEYCYTDLSKAFLIHAETHYAPLAPYIQTRLFDVSKPLAAQGLSPDCYDLVIASNVLHATQSIRPTLRNAKALLRNRGLLVLNELSGNSLSAHLTFGLLEGWWLYRDEALRIPGSPGLYPETWADLLEEEGFGKAWFPAASAAQLGQQIIVAESDGVVRQASEIPCRGEFIRPGRLKPPLQTRKFEPEATINKSPQGLREKAVAYLKQQVSETLKMPADEIDSAQALEAYGLDSILVVQLTNALHKHFKGITSTLFFEVQTIDALAAHLIKTQPDALTQRLGLDDSAQYERPPADKRPQLGFKKAPGRVSGPVPIAIIGLSGRYPQSADLNAFWDNLINGKNCIAEIPPERWDWQVYFDPEKGKPGSHVSKWGGFIDDVDRFDPLFFQISPRDAERMDPQERLFLETAYASIEDAGYTPENLCQSRKIGVFVGVMNRLYAGQASHWSIANRVSYSLNFQGPSLAVDTACSSSLTAIHLALESIYSGASECAIAGGVNLILDPAHYGLLSEMNMISAGDRCRSFGAGADGFVDGEGVGALVLKPLHKARADGDHIYGVIKASLLNAGGKTNGYTVPNPLAQSQLIAEALQKAGVHPAEVSYLEAHGTGTVLGDPIEVSALTQAFARVSGGEGPVQSCALGSVKSNIGHCESAAGIAGLTKVLLQMKHGQLAPSLHAEETNPHIDFADTPFIIQQKASEWLRPLRLIKGETREIPRIAGISSFGAGGANAHIILEEYKAPDEGMRKPVQPALIVLSGKDPERLQAVAARLLNHVEQAESIDLNDLAYTLQLGRVALEERLAFSVDHLDALKGSLRRFIDMGEGAQDFYRGQVKRHLDALNADDEDESIHEWIERRDYPRLLKAWVQGTRIDWRLLYRDARPKRISLPTYPFAGERYWLSNAVPERKHDSKSIDCMYRIDWQEQAKLKPEPRVSAGRLLIVATPESLAFAKMMEQSLGSARFIQLAERTLSETHCGMEDASGFETCLKDCSDFDAVYFVATGSRLGLESEPSGYEIQLLRLLKYLKQRVSRTASIDFFLLTQDAYRLNDSLTQPHAAGLTGLAYALAQSDHRFLVRHLDLAREDLDRTGYWPDLIRQLSKEPPSDRGDVVKLQQSRRYRQTFSLFDSGADCSAFKQQGVYAILGGSGAVGSIITRYLIERYQARVIWIGRRPESDPALQKKIQAFQGAVRYCQADATDLESMRDAVSRIKAHEPVLNGAVFSGVVFDFDHSIAQTTEAQFRRILEVKTLGSFNFYKAFRNEPLDFMCYFSSGQAFAFSGAANLPAYAAGIAFSDSFVHALQAEAPFPVGTINWGFWQASLDATSIGDRVGGLQDEEGFACFERFIAALEKKRSTQVLCLKASEAVRALMKGDAPETHAPLQAPRQDKAALLKLISRCFSNALKIPEAQIDPDIAFSDYGMDSVVATGFVKQVGLGLNIKLNSAIVFEYASINRLASHLLDQVKLILPAESLAPHPGPEGEGDSRCSLRDFQGNDPTKIDIAVIGMSGQFPGASDLEGFWRNLIEARQGVDRLPEHYRLSGADAVKPPDNPGYRWGGAMADRDCFDPLFFNIAPREAEAMSPHQRLVLQESWKALEAAGCNPKSLDDQAVGVFIGAEPSTYAQDSFTGASDAIIASRLSYCLNLRGPALVVNTGCSSSAVAIHLAVESLRRGESSLALAGGVFANLDEGMLMSLASIEMLSPTGRCHSFDAEADGTAFSEGVGIVALKRLSDAIADGDPIHGLIAATAINQDGASNGMTAPNGVAQQALIEAVYKSHRIDPEHIGYVEAHGTGTRLGDPVEANALVRAFRQFTDKRHYCAIGSTKAHIGHTSAGAGVIGLIRILLSMKHRVIPGLLNFKHLNPLIDFSESAFHVNAENIPWHSENGRPLMAALNSFGHSGTNAHLVVKEYIGREAAPSNDGECMIVLSAKNAERLHEYAASLLSFAQKNRASLNLCELAYTLQIGREAMAERLAFSCDSMDQLIERLNGFLNNRLEALHCGRVPRHNDLSDLFESEAALSNTLEGWFKQGLYDKLLSFWVKGLAIDWGLFYPNKPRRIGLPTYPFARERYWAKRKADGAAKPVVQPVAQPVLKPQKLAYAYRWQVQANRPFAPSKTPGKVLIVYSPSSSDLAERLAESHLQAQTIKLALSHQTRQLSAHEWQCSVDDAESLADCLKGYEAIDRVYFIAMPGSQALDEQSVSESQLVCELSLLRLIQTLKAKTAEHARVDFYCLTLDHYQMSGTKTQPLGAGVAGLAYALAQSDPRFGVRNIDLSSADLADPSKRQALVDLIRQEGWTDRGEVIKLSGGLRYKQRFYPLEFPSVETASAFKAGGVYVLLGGSGSVGRVITRYLLERHRAQVVWLGRSSESDPGLQQKLAGFRRWGGSLRYIQADANHLDSLKHAVAKIKQSHAAIDGAIFSGLVFHHERPLAETIEAEFMEMLSIKTLGSLNFYQALQHEPLDFMCYFSSIQAFAFLSAKDSAAYAAGILFSDSFAQSLQNKSAFPVGSIHWGYWADTTLGTGLADRLSKHFGLIGDEEGCLFFEKFVYCLQQRQLNQALCLRAEDSVQDLMGCTADEFMALCGQETPSLIQSLSKEGYVSFDDFKAGNWKSA